MICHQYQCIFVHIPKVAGQSIEDVFLKKTNCERPELLLKPNSDPSKGPPRLAHLTAEEYVKYNYIDRKLFNSYFKFSFVRNPWARLVSEYKFRHQNRYDFKTFLFKNFPKPQEDCYKKFTAEYRHIIPQYNFLFDSSGKQLVNFIGRFEHIQQDFDYICRQLQISPLTLPHKNKSSTNLYEKIGHKILSKLGFEAGKNKPKKVNYTEYYDQESIDHVASLYSKDIEVFKYQFD
ncbi:MAG: hypothetical protein Tsb0014_00320 [Pleurocapsa sp.]